MVRKWKLGATGSALLATAFVVVACSSKSDDDENGTGGTGAKGGTGGTGGTTGGGAGTVGTTGGGAGTTGTTGGTGGTGGGAGTTGTTGGTAGAATGGTAGAAAGASGFECTAPPAATCDSILTWGKFQNGTFGGGLYTYGQLTQDMADTTTFHVTGMITDMYSGFGIYLNGCSDISAYTGVSFVLSGTISSLDHANQTTFVIQSNTDEPIDAMNKHGKCVGSAGVDCISPHTPLITTGDAAQSFAFADLMGGKPVVTLMANDVLGFQWQLSPDTAKAAYAVDVKVDTFTLTGGTAKGECMAPAAAGAGGMGSGGAATGGMGGISAGAGGVAAGAGGAMGGMGGATGGMGGAMGGVGGKAGGNSGGKSGGGGKAAGGKAGGN